MHINRRNLRKSLGSRRVRRFGTKALGKTPPRVLLAKLVQEEMAKVNG